MKIEIKNKRKFYKFLEKSVNNYNPKSKGFYILTLQDQAKLTQLGQCTFVIPPIYTNDKKFKTYPYKLTRIKTKLIIEL